MTTGAVCQQTSPTFIKMLAVRRRVATSSRMVLMRLHSASGSMKPLVMVSACGLRALSDPIDALLQHWSRRWLAR